MELANEEVNVDIGLENVREGIAVTLSVIVVENFDAVVDCIDVGGSLLFDSWLKDISAM